MNAMEYKNIPALEKPENIFSLKDRTAIIIGGGGKMAEQFAQTLGYAGANLVLADRDGQKCGEAAKRVSETIGHPVGSCALNAGDEKEVESFHSSVFGDYNRIDVMIYNVMAKPPGYYRSFDKYSVDTWNDVLRGNLTGAFLCARAAAKYMKMANGGTIVLTSSTYGLVAPDQRIYDKCSAATNIYEGDEKLNCPAVYSASKAGLIGLAKYLASLWGDFNIRVNVFTPGGVFDGQEESFHQAYCERTVLKRMAQWSDYNGAILFLSSDASRYMTGANLVVDGGWTTW
jgi:NAD(P)-dependent dehydrogenase (short-subunit alcohol dehydrogenase family)